MELKQLLFADITKREPRLRFPIFSEPWEYMRLGDIGEVIGGGTPDTDKQTYWNGDINWFTPTEIKQKYLDASVRKISSEGLKKSSAKLLPAGTILLTTRATIADLSISRRESTTNQGFQSIIVNKNNFNEFIYYWILRNKQEFRKRANGSTFPEISNKEVKKIKGLFPSLPEQQKIAEFLGLVDEWLENLRAQKECLEKYKKGVMRKIFAREIRFKDDQGEDFADWEEKRLGDIAQKKSSTISANSLEKNVGNYKIYGATGFLKKVDFYQEEEPFISIIKDGAGVGRLLLCDSKSSVLGTLDILKPKEGVNLYFLYSLLREINFVKYITGATIPHIYFSEYKIEKLKIPTLAEQEKISVFLMQVDALISLKRREIIRAEEWKKALMQSLFV